MAVSMQMPTPKPAPHIFRNEDGLSLRLQCFLIVRDAVRKVACVKLKGSPGWALPGESLVPNEAPDMAAGRVGKVWFGADLPSRLMAVQSYPDDGTDRRWYILFIYEAQAPAKGLQAPDDTEAISFTAVGVSPGPFAMDHGAVFARLPP